MKSTNCHQLHQITKAPATQEIRGMESGGEQNGLKPQQAPPA